MKTKQIVFTKPYTAELLEAECLSPKANEVTLELAFSAISAGTERANYIGARNRVDLSEDTAPEFPRTVGYSATGVVTAIGENVKNVQVGDRVAAFWTKHKKHITLHKDGIIKLPDEVSLQEAAISYISVFPLAAIRKTRLEIGESALVMGLGILGILAVEELKAAGAYPIIAVDPIAERRELALKLGADFALDPTKEGFCDKVIQLTNGGAKVCIEVTGLGIGLIQALDCMKEMGRVALLGCTRSSKFEIDYYGKVHGRGISLIGAHTIARPSFESSAGLWTAQDDLSAVINLIKGGRLNFKDIISEIHSPCDAQLVYDRLANDKNFPVGVLFDWSKI